MVYGIVVGNMLMIHCEHIRRRLTVRWLTDIGGQRPGAAHVVGGLTQLMGARALLQIAARAVAIRGALAAG